MNEAALRQWVEAVGGHPVTHLVRLTGGASRTSFRAERSDAEPLLLRLDLGQGPLSNTPFTLEREYQVLSALTGRFDCVPPAIAFNPELKALLMGYIHGYSSGQIDLEVSAQIAQQQQLLQEILRLQQVAPKAAGLAQTASIADAIHAELDIWEELYRQQVSEQQPILEFCWRWLREAIPDADEVPVLVHGDVGSGNFLFDAQGKILALIDWELVHQGHPLEDLACVLCRSLGAPLGHERQMLDWYAQTSGKPLSLPALRYCIVLVLTRWSVGINIALSRLDPQLDVAMLLTFRQSNLMALIQQLAVKFDLDVSLPAARGPSSLPAAGLFNYLIENCSQVLTPLAQDAFQRHRLTGLTQITRYLRDLSCYGMDRYVDEEIQHITKLIGRDWLDYHGARLALSTAARDGGQCSDRELLQHFIWWLQREHSLLHAAMGAMAERRLDLPSGE